jgi:outer membrane protein
MKKKILILFFVVSALVLVFGQIGLAQDMNGKFGIGARIGYVNYAGDDYGVSGSNFDVDFDAAAMYGGNLVYYLHSYFSLELSADYVKTDTEIKGFGLSPTNIGELKQVPIILNGRFHFSTNQKISPYLSAGIGYYINDFDLSDSLSSVLPSGSELDPEDSIGFNLGGGIQFLLNEHFALDLDLKYIWNKADFEAKVPGVPTEEISIDLDNFYVGIGLKYYF